MPKTGCWFYCLESLVKSAVTDYNHFKIGRKIAVKVAYLFGNKLHFEGFNIYFRYFMRKQDVGLIIQSRWLSAVTDCNHFKIGSNPIIIRGTLDIENHKPTTAYQK